MKNHLIYAALVLLMVALCTACANSNSGNRSEAETSLELSDAPLEVIAERPGPEEGTRESNEPPPETEVADVVIPDAGGIDTVELILSSFSTKTFSDDPVPAESLDLILQSGAAAPSARNLQPWHFTVITNSELLSQACRDATAGTVGILISGLDDEPDGIDVSFDCGLATQNMYIAAHSLGLGAHIYMGGVEQFAQGNHASLDIPRDYEAMMLLVIGYTDNPVDASASASTRNPLSDTVNYVD